VKLKQHCCLRGQRGKYLIRCCILYSDLVIVIVVLLWKLLVIVQLIKMEVAKLKGF